MNKEKGKTNFMLSNQQTVISCVSYVRLHCKGNGEDKRIHDGKHGHFGIHAGDSNFAAVNGIVTARLKKKYRTAS